MRKLLAFEISTQDVGCTQAATIRLGDFSLGTYYTGTKYPDRSLEIIEHSLGIALTKLLDLSPALEPLTFEDSEEDW